MKWLLRSLALVALSSPAFAGSIAVTPGSGTTVGAGSDGSAQIPASVICGGNAATLYTTCATQLLITAGGAASVTATNTTFGLTGNSNTAFVDAGHGLLIAPESNTLWGMMSGTTPGTAPGATHIVGGIYNASPPAPSTGQTLPFQLTSAGALIVSGGGVSSGINATFPTTGTAMGAEYLTSAPTLTTGQMVAAQASINGSLFVDVQTGGLGGIPAFAPPASCGSSPSPITLTFLIECELTVNAAADVLGSSTAASTTNNALVVSVSPNSPAPIGNKPVGAATTTINQIAVQSSATLIAAARTGAIGTGRVSITVTNTATTAVYIGTTSGVTSSNGMFLAPIAGASLTLDTTSAIYGIASGPETITYAETY